MKRITINLSDELAEILKEIQRRERYRSPSEAIQSSIRHWALSQQPHSLTGPWASLPGEERDRIDQELAALVKSGKGQKGSWLKARIYDCIKELCGPEAKTPTVDQVMGRLPETIRKSI
jgi:Arc/MetJ-type ribon-helix-helix transcriptional regulator